ncbi:hypothetical protein EVAR_70872_1 [Eumeta japonica]|uniref:Uncharacterized protein n=1 Tax=Eumeta variegata TaxID=151549 RepID=A0A4C2AFX9_EUMVA|nr:hypothetical protein EVAR_70872_1 [Eumeta japonica]
MIYNRLNFADVIGLSERLYSRRGRHPLRPVHVHRQARFPSRRWAGCTGRVRRPLDVASKDAGGPLSRRSAVSYDLCRLL